MKVVRGRADARWLPSRFRFAASRLIAYAAFRFSGPKPVEGVVLGVDRDQSAIEQYFVAVWMMIILTCVSFDLLAHSFSIAASLLIAPLIATAVVSLVPVLPALVWPPRRDRENLAVCSFLMMALLITSAIYMAGRGTWTRYPAWAFLALVAANAAAALILPAFRSTFERLEREAGAA